VTNGENPAMKAVQAPVLEASAPALPMDSGVLELG
jgi:hypothetical protein